MNKILKSRWMIGVLVGLIGMSACKKTELPSFDPNFTGIYFQQDSIYYSFGVTKLETTTYEWKIPVRIMGEPTAQDRIFEISIDTENTTANEGVHFDLPPTLEVKANSVDAYIPVQLNRETLGEADFKLTLVLEANNNFTPVNAPFKSTTLHFNNRVEPPSWKDFAGRPTWPTSQLGPWNPIVYVKFIEYFRAIEEKSPATYKNMVDQFGPDLANVTFGWPWDYNFTMIKYVQTPLYQYFMEENPELGITIPRPSGY